MNEDMTARCRCCSQALAVAPQRRRGRDRRPPRGRRGRVARRSFRAARLLLGFLRDAVRPAGDRRRRGARARRRPGVRRPRRGPDTGATAGHPRPPRGGVPGPAPAARVPRVARIAGFGRSCAVGARGPRDARMRARGRRRRRAPPVAGRQPVVRARGRPRRHRRRRRAHARTARAGPGCGRCRGVGTTASGMGCAAARGRRAHARDDAHRPGRPRCPRRRSRRARVAPPARFARRLCRARWYLWSRRSPSRSSPSARGCSSFGSGSARGRPTVRTDGSAARSRACSTRRARGARRPSSSGSGSQSCWSRSRWCGRATTI